MTRYDEYCIFPNAAILKHKQVACERKTEYFNQFTALGVFPVELLAYQILRKDISVCRERI